MTSNTAVRSVHGVKVNNTLWQCVLRTQQSDKNMEHFCLYLYIKNEKNVTVVTNRSSHKITHIIPLNKYILMKTVVFLLKIE